MAKKKDDKTPEPKKTTKPKGKKKPTDGATTPAVSKEAEQRPDPTGPKETVNGTRTGTTTSDGCATDKPKGSLMSRLGKSSNGDLPPHGIVKALAGTGKTTTVVEGMKVVKGLPPRIEPSPQQAVVWEAMKLGKSDSIRFHAFGAAIAAELKSRLEQCGLDKMGCEASTFHSLGNRAVYRQFGRLEVNTYATQDHISKVMGKDVRELRDDPKAFALVRACSDLVDLVKVNLSATDEDSLNRLVSHYDVETEDVKREDLFGMVPEVLELCKNPSGKITFTDMIWLPNVLDLPIHRADMILVDECQDLNRAQQQLAYKAGHRIIAVGDENQAIFGFAGADAESMRRLEAELGAQTKTEQRDRVLKSPLPGESGDVVLKAGSKLTWQSDQTGAVVSPGPGWSGRGVKIMPLTVTRRCGKAIVEEARKIVPEFEAHSSNPAGRIRTAKYPIQKRKLADGSREAEELPWDQTYCKLVEQGDFVLCRVNAPLVGQCFRFLKRGIKAVILGRDVGKGLITLVQKLSNKGSLTVAELVGKVTDWIHTEVGKESAKRYPSESRIISIQDKGDCLLSFCEDMRTVDEVVRRIESVFADKVCPSCKKGFPVQDTVCGKCIVPLVLPSGVKFSSIHKSKGLEARRVFLLQPEGGTVPHPMAKKAWQVEQEWNLLYVAITRAIEELIYVS